MKSLITRNASISTIFIFLIGTIFTFLGGFTTTQAQFPDPSQVHVHKGAIALFTPSTNMVIVKVTTVCTGGTGTVHVVVTQTAAQSNANLPASGSGSSSVKCDGQQRDIAVSVGAAGDNLGEASAMVTLTPPSVTPVTITRTIVIGFPVIEGMEQEDGGNPEE